MIRRFALVWCFCASPLFAGVDVIDEGGVNGNDSPILFSVRALSERFTKRIVSEFIRPNPFGAENDLIVIGSSNGPIFYADHGLSEIYTFSIWTESPAVSGPNGVIIGQTRVEKVNKLGHWDCARGYNEMHDTVACMWWEEGLRLVFDFDPTGKNAITSGTYDPVLDDAVLVEIRQYFNRPVQ